MNTTQRTTEGKAAATKTAGQKKQRRYKGSADGAKAGARAKAGKAAGTNGGGGGAGTR